MKNALHSKLIFLTVIILAILVPLSLIEDLIRERQSARDEARYDIEKSWSPEQTFIGPLLVFEYTQRTAVTTREAGSETVSRVLQQPGKMKILPSAVNVSALLNVEERYRGIYSFPVYTADIDFEAEFPAEIDFPSDFSNGKIYLALGVSEMVGIQGTPVCEYNNASREFAPGTRLMFNSGMNIELAPLEPNQQNSFQKFKCRMQLRGSGSFQAVPLAKASDIKVTANWGHPKFIGNVLPISREISAESFTARWTTSQFTSSWGELLTQCSDRVQSNCTSFTGKGIGAALYEPVDVYRATTRAVKYALLFVCLTFASFLVFEIFKDLQIHPVQYGFVGLSLAVFYLLLLSLSEHVTFGWSYLTAAAACVSTLTVYSRSLLGNFQRAAGFSVCLSGLYGFLYVVLQSEDLALLMGSLLTFGVLSFAMLATRHVDWYKLTASKAKKEAEATKILPVTPA